MLSVMSRLCSQRGALAAPPVGGSLNDTRGFLRSPCRRLLERSHKRTPMIPGDHQAPGTDVMAEAVGTTGWEERSACA